MKLENEYGMRLELNLDGNDNELQCISIETDEVNIPPRYTFICGPEHRKEINRYFQGHAHTLVHNEDLKAMLDCLVVHISSGYKQRDAVVDAINRLESIYGKYRTKEKNNED